MSILTIANDPTTRKWTAKEFYRLADQGYFQNQRVELVEGEIVQMSPQGSLHGIGIGMVVFVLDNIFPKLQYWVRSQITMDLSNKTVVDPDVSVVEGSVYDQDNRQNVTTALLIVEVSLTTLEFDRSPKGNLYAKAGIEDYWILNLVDRQLEIYRQPQPDPSEPLGHVYSDVQYLDANSKIAPLAQPNATIAVADLLP